MGTYAWNKNDASKQFYNDFELLIPLTQDLTIIYVIQELGYNH